MNDSTTSRNKERLFFFYKRNIDSNIKCCTIILTEPTMPLIFMRNPVGLFYLWGYVSISKTNINNRTTSIIVNGKQPVP